jgi:dihydrodiol dehydrogenase / D-xylose 1-dehydrogenase (NADP)
LPADSRLSDLSLGAGTILDVGIYTLTWASISLHPLLVNGEKEEHEEPSVKSIMTLNKGRDEITTVILNYPEKHAQAICTSTFLHKTPQEFGRIEGDEGAIIVRGIAASKPGSLVVQRKGDEEKILDFPINGWGFFYEADAVARDIRDGRTENETMPLAESLRIMRMMDEARKQNGVVYPQDST